MTFVRLRVMPARSHGGTVTHGCGFGFAFVGVEHCSTPSRQNVSKTVIPNQVRGVKNPSSPVHALYGVP